MSRSATSKHLRNIWNSKPPQVVIDMTYKLEKQQDIFLEFPADLLGCLFVRAPPVRSFGLLCWSSALRATRILLVGVVFFRVAKNGGLKGNRRTTTICVGPLKTEGP